MPSSNKSARKIAKKATKKATRKVAKKKSSTSTATTSVVKKTRKPREKKKLFATVSLKTLLEVIGNDPETEVVVSRNFILDAKTGDAERKAAEDLGI